ncbi:ABC transporter substrate-binding protein [Actinomadura rayongensis]|uniref:Extracellular solute-binding protein n=1 Tax=Actinomadura rayongensis TaxID=1429076 RepID=A0A6I4WID2_9ACTN|nr:ABC transporter substrate-binding protein [Actinomadura rayongensis]MXQ66392.1 extracellular solute-binding protein [Actinomadura rayongensis]
MLRGLAAVALLAAGCAPGDGRTLLTVDLFGEFGYERLYREYEAAHPEIRVRQRRISVLDDYAPRLRQRIATGHGAGDVVALEEGLLPAFLRRPERFVDLSAYGGRALEPYFLPWKWRMGVAADGRLVGLGTDIGPLALCYRPDLFARAGLPTARDAVARLWPTWDAYYRTGLAFERRLPGVRWLDGPTAVFRAALLQEAGRGPGFTYFDRSGRLVFASNPAVRTAFATALRFERARLTADLQVFTPSWQTALRRDRFATVPCPAWMLGGLAAFSGGRGRWDVATAPGGAGSWGGSWLAVPRQTRHPARAAALAAFLTSPHGQVAAFRARSTFPSSPQAARDPVVAGSANAFFGGAPTGRIFGAVAARVRPVYLGPRNEDVRVAVDDVLLSVGQGRLAARDAWPRAVRAAAKAAR